MGGLVLPVTNKKKDPESKISNCNPETLSYRSFLLLHQLGQLKDSLHFLKALKLSCFFY
jgi:hypothetical protein